MNDGPLVSTDWLAENLDDPLVRVVDCRWYLRPFDLRDGVEEYRAGHIPGAVHIRWDTDIADPGRPDLYMLAGPERFAAAMGDRGIGDDTFVVAYDDRHVTVAARLWWALRVHGHERVAVLDGGIGKWRAEGRPVDVGEARVPNAQFTSTRADHLSVTMAEVRTALGTGVGLVDGRMTEARAEDGGAIPGSVALPGIEFTNVDGTWADASEIRARISDVGLDIDAPIITYCRGGVGACGTALAFAIAGREDVAVYDGSWTEWITDPDSPRELDPAMSRVVVVTGAAGDIGAAVMARFVAGGDSVVGLDTTESDGTIVCDIADEEQVSAAFASIRARHGDPVVLVNNAGITGHGGIEDEDPSSWRRILDVNLTGAFLCTREVIAGMRTAGGGRIVNMASVNARFGGSALSGPAYAASKGGLVTLTRFLAREHASDGIRVNAVAPGPHSTQMWDALDPGLRERILAMVPGDAPGAPADLAAIVHFLCAPETGYVTGATFDVNGGQWMG